MKNRPLQFLSTKKVMILFKKNWQKILFITAFIIHLSFYVSAFYTHWWDVLFENVTTGQDFFQIPNAAYSFLHGGNLRGELPPGIKPYTSCCGVNGNVYHPLFTLLVGTPLQLFTPNTALKIWTFVHILISAILLLFLWKKFANHKYLYLALSLYLLNSYHYYEIKHAQYHFLLTFFTTLFLYESAIKGDTKRAGLWYFLSILIKPIGFLWILPLLIYKRFRTLTIGLGLYALASIPFIITPLGKYFFNNLGDNLNSQGPTYNLAAIVHFEKIPLVYIKIASLFSAIFLLIFQIIKKSELYSTIFLWVSFQLIFYALVYPYHYSITAGLICLGILLNQFSFKRNKILPLIILTLPTPILFLRWYGAPAVLTPQQFSGIALWSIFWLTLTCFQLNLKKY